MPRGRVVRTVAVVRTPRVAQLEGYFDLPPTAQSELAWDVELPCEARPWAVGLIVGPSGSGKSTIARELFGTRVVSGFPWPADKSVVDGFPAAMSIKAITALLSSVGFSSPPAWLRPFGVLSTGEQFRVTLARALAESGTALTVMDEFTSVIDRRVAQIGSAALAKTVRRNKQQFIAVTCHYDVEDWLQPDWIYQPHLQQFQWRELHPRPPIALRVTRCGPENWARFRQHHYLSASLNTGARCFLTWCGDDVAGFTAVLPMMGFKGRWREHRTVCLPDFQGVGIGMAQSSLVGAVVRAATGAEYSSTTSHPAFIAARARSPEWMMVRRPAFNAAHDVGNKTLGGKGVRAMRSFRLTASFKYVGPPLADVELARALWSENYTGGAKVRTHTSASAEVAG
jgi:hypothetical protein